MSPQARNVLREGASEPPDVSTGGGGPGSHRVFLGAPRGFPVKPRKCRIPTLYSLRPDFFCSAFLGLCIRSKNPSYTTGCCKDIFPFYQTASWKSEGRGDREVPLLLSPTGCIVSKLLALTLGVKSSVSNSIPIFCWNYSNPRPQHIQNYELNIEFPSIFNSCGYESFLICSADMLASKLHVQSKGFNCFA